MNLLEILISSLLGSVILMGLTQSGYQIYASLDQQVAKATLQSEALQALQMMGEAIQIANGTPYGLVGGVFTRDLDRATGAARQLRAGQVFVNEWYASGVETPFGGFGKSGYGREKGREALWNYVQTKNVAIKLQG